MKGLWSHTRFTSVKKNELALMPREVIFQPFHDQHGFKNCFRQPELSKSLPNHYCVILYVWSGLRYQVLCVLRSWRSRRSAEVRLNLSLEPADLSPVRLQKEIIVGVPDSAPVFQRGIFQRGWSYAFRGKPFLFFHRTEQCIASECSRKKYSHWKESKSWFHRRKIFSLRGKVCPEMQQFVSIDSAKAWLQICLKSVWWISSSPAHSEKVLDNDSGIHFPEQFEAICM